MKFEIFINELIQAILSYVASDYCILDNLNKQFHIINVQIS